MTKKSENNENSKKITKKEQKELEKELLKKSQDKLEKKAASIVKRKMTELQLAEQVQLSEDQKIAVKFLADGLGTKKTAEKLNKSEEEINQWMKVPAFLRAVNEATLKDGISDRSERIRRIKRILNAVDEEIFEKIENDDLSNMRISDLSRLRTELINKLDFYVDKKEDIATRDLTVLLINHVQEKNGKEYKEFNDLLNDPDFQFPTIETEFKEIKNEE